MREEERMQFPKAYKKRIVFTAILLLLGILSLMGTTYAIFSSNLKGKNVVIHAKEGSFDLTFYEDESYRLQNTSTMTEEEAAALDPYHFTIANHGVADAYYEIALIEEGNTANQVSKEYLGYSLTGDDGTTLSGTLSELGTPMNVVRAKRLAVGETVNYNLRIWLTSDAPNSEMGKTYQSKVGVSSVQALSTFADFLIQKANQEGTSYQKGNPGELFAFNEAATKDSTRVMSYRYLGNRPNNYVLMNNTLWRIIGVFQVDAYGYNPQVKLIQEEGLMGAYGINSRTPSLLTTSAYYERLDEESRKMILYHPYAMSALSLSDLKGDVIDQNEHNQTIATLSSLVGLPTLSDYVGTFRSGYQEDCLNDISHCTTTSWLSRERMTFSNQVGTDENQVYTLDATGCVLATAVSSSLLNRPVVYLNALTAYVSGTGSQQNPYRIALQESIS